MHGESPRCIPEKRYDLSHPRVHEAGWRAGSFELAPVDARAWPEVGSPDRWTSSRRRHQHDQRRPSLPLWQVRRGLGGGVELNGCAQADFSPSVSQGAPKINFGEGKLASGALPLSP